MFADGTHVGFQDQVVLGDTEVTSDILPWLNPLLWWLITALSSLGVPFLPYLLGQLYKRRVAGGLLGAEEEEEADRRGIFNRVLINPQDIALLEQQAARRAQAQVEERLQVGVVVVLVSVAVAITIAVAVAEIGAAKPCNLRGSHMACMGLWKVLEGCGWCGRCAVLAGEWQPQTTAGAVLKGRCQSLFGFIASLKLGQVRDVPCLLWFLPVGLVPGVIQYKNYPMLGATHTCHRVCILQELTQPDGIGPPEEVNIASAEASALQYLGLLAVTIAAGFFFFQKAFDDGEVHWLPLLGTLVTAYLTYKGVYYLRLQNYVDTVQRPQSRVRTPWKDVILLLPDSPRQ